jgi:hypothetical protein
MKRFFLCVGFLGMLYSAEAQQQHLTTLQFTVQPADLSDGGYLSNRIELKRRGPFYIKLTNIETEAVAQLPAGIKASGSFDPDIISGTERKKHIALLRIPAYRKQGGNIERLVSYTVEITEMEEDRTAQRPTLAENSVLATGTWYKVAVPHRGIFKIDYNFLQSIGVNPSSINPQHIRVFGNGGTVLPERISGEQPDDLIENAVYVSAAGSSFGQGDVVLFYANGPVLFEKDSLNARFRHVANYYEDYSYYFLNFDSGVPGKRIQSESAQSPGAATDITVFDDYFVRDLDSFNLGNIGKVWWSNKMSSIGNTLEQTVPVNVPGLAVPQAYLESSFASKSDHSSNGFKYSINNALVETVPLGSQYDAAYIAAYINRTVSLVPGANTLKIQYLPGGGNATGYLDYVRINYRRHLDFAGSGGQLSFRDWSSAGLGNGYAAFRLANPGSNIQVWEVTDPLSPVKLEGTMADGKYVVARQGDRLREFIAFDGSSFATPLKLDPSVVANQNLHALPQTDFLIITRNDLVQAAEALAEFHRSKNGIHVTVTTVDKIYNEFSSGGQDIGGIRNFVKMFYDRAQSESDMLKNVLFFGAASFDYKNRINFNTNIVPTFQTYLSQGGSVSYSSDDFFGLLDEGDDKLLDVGLGRIPAYDVQEGLKVVEKIKNYASANSFGPWKNVITYVADDKDAGSASAMNHLQDCEVVNEFFLDSSRQYNLYKIYADAHPLVAAAAGSRYPSVNKAINDRIATGTLLMSYSGHGSPDRWADEAILSSEDYGLWRNLNKLPVMLTATCDFGRFDDPTHRSAGARLMMSPNGGSIAMVTTTQVVYASPNTALNKQFTRKQFLPGPDGTYLTLGQALTAAKNAYLDSNGSVDNTRKFVLLGDPALSLQIPVHNVVTTAIMEEKDGAVEPTDTIKALGRYQLQGSVTDRNGNVLEDFDGEVYVTIFDKIRTIPTINTRHDREGVTPSFRQQTSVVANVRGTVAAGKFTVNFIVPKDINFNYGDGKISYYAHSQVVDASGLDTNIIVGGFNTNAADDNQPPVVKPYIDNEKFRDGGITGPNPTLYVKLFDDNGINVSGSSIGHDLVAILDEDMTNPFVMNDFYVTEPNDYRNGYVNFKFYNLPDGKHTIRVRAWDVYNNSGEGVVTFEVRNKDKGFISDLYNYPNPFSDKTIFVFQHNQESESMDVHLQIFSSTGQLVKTINKKFEAVGNRSELEWDGRAEHGQQLPNGIYFYRLQAKTDKGVTATAYQKMVLRR